MPGINMSVAHSLKQAEALKRIKKLVEELKDQYSGQVTDVHETWKGNQESLR